MKPYLLAAALAVSISPIAEASDLPSKRAPALAPIAMSKAYEWSGAYIGLNGGQGTSNSDITNIYFDETPSPGDEGTLDMNGGMVGGQIGYNYQTGNIILGLEADLDYTNVKGTHLFEFGGNPVSLQGELNSLATVRARFGYAIDNLLIFATGGFAFGSTNATLTSVVPPVISASGSKSYAGYALGGGIEYGLTRNWTVKAEYLHVDLGTQSNTYMFTGDIAEAAADTSLRSDIVRVGLNYKI